MLTVSTQIHKLSIFYCILTFCEQSESKLQKSPPNGLHLFRMKENILLHNHSIIITKTLTLIKYYLIYSSHLNFSVPKIMSSIAAFPHPGSNWVLFMEFRLTSQLAHFELWHPHTIFSFIIHGTDMSVPYFRLPVQASCTAECPTIHEQLDVPQSVTVSHD